MWYTVHAAVHITLAFSVAGVSADCSYQRSITRSIMGAAVRRAAHVDELVTHWFQVGTHASVMHVM